MEQNKISIVTPSFNQGKFLEQTICSVLQQDYSNLEYIIIDGGSSDESVPIIKKYSKHLKFWRSEKDGGQTDAIKAGLKYCTGNIFNWVNSDDYLEKGALKLINENFQDTHINAVAGLVRVFDEDRSYCVANSNLSAEGLLAWSKNVQFVQPGVWIKRSLIDVCGGLNTDFHFAFDWDLMIRYLYFFPRITECNAVLSNFRLHQNSKTVTQQQKFAEEERRIIKDIWSDQRFVELHCACKRKIHKEEWTAFLSRLSEEQMNVFIKMSKLLRKSFKYSDLLFSRQTLGAVNAYLHNKKF
jgi:glycosyltransferase involved in cell wall biosynthesis